MTTFALCNVVGQPFLVAS